MGKQHSYIFSKTASDAFGLCLAVSNSFLLYIDNNGIYVRVI